MARVNIPALTGLRFVAALMVVLGHGYPVLRFVDDRYIGALVGPFAASAMSLFFVLSGVVLWLNYGQSFQREDFPTTLRRFCVARFARLYPLLMAVVLVGVVVSQPGHFVAALPSSLLYLGALQGWVPGTGSQPLTLAVENLGHTWSIGAEVFLYLLFPAIALGAVGGVLVLVIGAWIYGADLAFPYRATRLADLGRLRAALSAYRQDHGFYPSSGTWSGLYWPDTPGENWLPGLVPGYLASLPRDPRHTDIMHAQYIYRSDGHDYKLLAMLPEDCALTVSLNPRLADPARNAANGCIAYGYWTSGAGAW
jgi:Acyltransferase family